MSKRQLFVFKQTILKKICCFFFFKWFISFKTIIPFKEWIMIVLKDELLQRRGNESYPLKEGYDNRLFLNKRF